MNKIVSIGITVFPGTNNEHETKRALNSIEDVDAQLVYHYEPEKIAHLDGIYIAGGFSYGDVLRAGAVAATTDIVEEIREFAKDGKPVIGICNGFQILTEADLLPGALLPNTSTRFISKFIHMRIEKSHTFLNELEGEIIHLPIAHFEGNYWTDQETETVIARYVNNQGETVTEANPNGSVDAIAGVSDGKNVIGLMPHPERATFDFQGSSDGRKIIDAFVEAAKC